MAVNEESSIPEETALPLEFADLNAMIAELAYYKAESRGFAPGTKWRIGLRQNGN